MNGTRDLGWALGRHSGPVIALVLAILCADSVAQTTVPIKRDSVENQPIRQRATSRPAGATVVTPPRSTSLMDLPRVVGALAIVIGLIFAARWVAKRYFPALAGGRAVGVVRVLSRSPVTARQQVLLVQVGKRILVVADNGTQMNRLADITDPDEVASLVGQLAAKPETPADQFDEKLDVAAQSFETPSDRITALEDTDPPQDAAAEEIEGLMQKVRVLAKQLGRS